MSEPNEDTLTEEMIDAGALAVARYDGRFESEEEAAIRIYAAMIAVKPTRPD